MTLFQKIDKLKNKKNAKTIEKIKVLLDQFLCETYKKVFISRDDDGTIHHYIEVKA
jgi:GTP-binding protein EngB required for normal cell division